MSKTKTIDLTSGPILKSWQSWRFRSCFLAAGDSLQYYGHGMDRHAGFQSRCRGGRGGMYVWLSQGLVALPRMGGQVNVAQPADAGDYEQARG